MESPSLRFAAAVRTLGDTARARGLVMPTFRSPPGLADAHRSIRRARGVATVAVALRNRPWAAVLADMIEGIVVANHLGGLDADGVRAELWAAVAEPVDAAA
ncbi:MAG: hypothetical protein ACR2QE_04540 [Acidimicrobiales bacterium]